MNVDDVVYGTRSVRQPVALPTTRTTPLLEEVKRWSLGECDGRVRDAAGHCTHPDAAMLCTRLETLLEQYHTLVNKYAAAQQRLENDIRAHRITDRQRRHRELYLQYNPLRCIRRQLKEAVYFLLGYTTADHGTVQASLSRSKLESTLNGVELGP
jgi:hypothetical protein